MTKAEQARATAWRPKILRWAQDEPRELGEAGLADRPRTPHRSPRATSPAVVSKILYLRQKYHFGPGRIAAYLARFHQIAIACSSVHRLLAKHGMNRLPANQKHQPHQKRWKRHEKPQPGHRLQMDVKVLERIPAHQRMSMEPQNKAASSLELPSPRSRITKISRRH
jgi:hypothetical protein